jgi:EAL domain-containing protein (putative c-di-GMP-specific phosphodiesterase class I)
MWVAHRRGAAWAGELTNRRKDGSLYWVDTVISPMRAPDGSTMGYVSSGRDVSRERELEWRTEVLTRERLVIADTIKTLPPGGSLEERAELICRRVQGLTDVVMASIVGFDSVGSGMPLAYVAADEAMVGLRLLPAERSRYLREHAQGGPWVERWTGDRAHPYAASIRAVGARAFAYVPVPYDGALMGILLVGSARQDAVEHLSGQLGALMDFGGLAGAMLGQAIREWRDQNGQRSDIEGVIARCAFTPVFQPIVDLRTGNVVGHEALTRFTDGSAPDRRFAQAADVGLGIDLECATLESALAAASALPRRWLHLNVTPQLVLSAGRLRDLLQGAHSRIVLEVTEHAAIADYLEFREAVASIGLPVQLAVDDAGAGFASLRHILELRPTFVKLDISLVRGIDADPAKQALVAGMRHFTRSTGRRLIAEGVETAAEADTLRDLDIRLAQGYLLGRAAALTTTIGARRPA